MAAAMASQKPAESILISPNMLESLMTRGHPALVLIDTRPPAAYQESHIPGAVNVHDIFTYLAATTADGAAEMRNKFAKLFGDAGLSGSETAVVYEDQMHTGFGQSCRGYVLLRYLGYPEDQVYILDGGIAAWISAGKPTTLMASSPTPKTFPVSSSGQGILVDVEEMTQIVGAAENGTVILDTRDVEEWDGLVSSPYGRDFCPRKGRIPGAVWIEWRRMLEETPAGVRIKAREGVLQECMRVGIRPDSTVILYCFKGARASNTLVALREAGVRRVRLYMGSWNEWSRDASLPILG